MIGRLHFRWHTFGGTNGMMQGSKTTTNTDQNPKAITYTFNRYIQAICLRTQLRQVAVYRIGCNANAGNSCDTPNTPANPAFLPVPVTRNHCNNQLYPDIAAISIILGLFLFTVNAKTSFINCSLAIVVSQELHGTYPQHVALDSLSMSLMKLCLH